MKQYLFLIILVFVATSISYGQTYVSGEVSGVWEITGSPFYVQGDITVPDDSTLTIEPGDSIIFEGYYTLNVQGRLIALGTEANNITFTINDTTGFYNPNTISGGWNGIQFIDTPEDNDTSKISFCTIQYGKAVGSILPENSGGALYVSGFNKLLVSNCLITNNSAGGTNSPSGGGIALNTASITLLYNEISFNHAWDGGGIQIWESDPVFINNTIVFNNADEAGGGIWIGGVSNTGFSGDVISYNTASGNGGGLICWQTTITNFDSVSVIGNIADNGGGINLTDCELHVSGGSLSDNAAGWIGGGINAYSSIIEISNTTFERDTAYIFGGAMGIYYSDLTINNSIISDNGARNLGGGIHSDGSNINITNSTFERDTTSDSGGAMFTWICDLMLDDCDFINNSSNNGGAISSDSSSVRILNSNFIQNSAIWGGGVTNNRGDLVLNDCSFAENISEHGGAVYIGFSNAELTDISFEQNHSIWGGGISTTNSNLSVDSCMFSQNSVTSEAGAIEYLVDTLITNDKLSIQITNSEFSNNISENLFGGVKIMQDNSDTSLCSVKFENNKFMRNSANSYAAVRFIGNIGDIEVNNSIFESNYSTLLNSIFSANSGAKVKINNSVFAKNYPRAASLNINARMDFMNCTFINNFGTSSAALSLRRNAEVTITNSILWENGNNQITLITVDTSGNILNLNYCDTQYGLDSISISDTLSIVNWGIGNINSDPLLLDTLNSNYHLQNFSPCIQAGIDSIEITGFWYYTPLTDIEGNPRPYPLGTMPDIGAYEYQNLVGVKDQNLDLPTEYTLFQNYPNPFNPVTTIRYSIPEKSEVRLEILNILGEQVKLLVNDIRVAGTFDAVWNASNLASGIYFYRLRADNFNEIKKMILLK